VNLGVQLELLSRNGIEAGVLTAPGNLFRVWIGDGARGVLDTALVASKRKAADWLDAAVLRHYPRSAYAHTLRFLFAVCGKLYPAK
jgi:hypothetical protein